MKKIFATIFLIAGALAAAATPRADVETLLKQEKKGVPEASIALAELALAEYRVADVDAHLEALEKSLKKQKKKTAVPARVEEIRREAATLGNMLERVEKIAIIDSLVVDSAEFFRSYRLSDEAGKIYEGAFLPPQYSDLMPRMVFLPQSRTELFWGQPTEGGKIELVSAQILDDGSVQEGEPIGASLGEGGDADFPYFTNDGVTFYFANNGENSIGGYDIFMSRRQPDGTVYEPQNMGMPYNSPYDDYMLVIDEAAGLGWWATDRNQIPGKVTIYVFVPNDTRVNYDADDPNIAAYAKVSNIKLTQPEGLDASALLDNPILHANTGEKEQEVEFLISLGNGTTYSRLSQFRNPQARLAAQQYIARSQELDLMKRKLEVMRQGYAGGDKAVGDEILSLEKRIVSAQAMLKRLRNSAISLELGKN